MIDRRKLKTNMETETEKQVAQILTEGSPNAHTADLIPDDEFTVLAAGETDRGDRPLPQTFVDEYQTTPAPQPNAQPANEDEQLYAEAREEILRERVEFKKAARAFEQITGAFVKRHAGEYTANPANSQLMSEALQAAGLPLTPENLEKAFEATRFAMDNRKLSEFSAEEIEAAQKIAWPMPPRELYATKQPAPAPAPVKSFSTGLSDRPDPVTAAPVPMEDFATAIGKMPLDDARVAMVQAMRRAALAGGDRTALADAEYVALQRRLHPSQF
jgi:hypothetical protein